MTRHSRPRGHWGVCRAPAAIFTELVLFGVGSRAQLRRAATINERKMLGCFLDRTMKVRSMFWELLSRLSGMAKNRRNASLVWDQKFVIVSLSIKEDHREGMGDAIPRLMQNHNSTPNYIAKQCYHFFFRP